MMSDVADEVMANALEAQKFTRKHMVVELDFTPESIQQLEQQFDPVEYTLKGGKSDENIRMLTRIWGSYLGEVLRRHGGGQWVREEGDPPRVALRGQRQTLHPHEQVRQRLTAGAQYDIWAYFQQQRGQL